MRVLTISIMMQNSLLMQSVYSHFERKLFQGTNTSHLACTIRRHWGSLCTWNIEASLVLQDCGLLHLGAQIFQIFFSWYNIPPAIL